MVPIACLHPFLTGQSELTFSNNLFSPTLKANNGKLQYSNYLTPEQLESHILYGISGLMYLSSEFYDPEFRDESFRSYIQA